MAKMYYKWRFYVSRDKIERKQRIEELYQQEMNEIEGIRG